MQELHLTQEWDKVFPKSDKVDHKKVTFTNHFGITLAADQYTPKNYEGKLPALAVAGPFGAVKEQSSGLYAQTMAERGYLTIAFDPYPLLAKVVAMSAMFFHWILILKITKLQWTI